MKQIDLNVGQLAYIIPYTSLTVDCPVHYFSNQELEWLHPGQEKLSYSGSNSNRVEVDKRGRLQIRSLRLSDQGKWICIAGPINASLTLRMRTPAAGFHDWIQRNRLWTKGMLNDDSKSITISHELVQWVEGSWGACSTSCGEEGQQYRIVRCEKVDKRFYQILDDKVCLDKFLVKPLTTRKCFESKICPSWNVKNRDDSVVSFQM